jgi:hypothetical protein
MGNIQNLTHDRVPPILSLPPKALEFAYQPLKQKLQQQGSKRLLP